MWMTRGRVGSRNIHISTQPLFSKMIHMGGGGSKKSKKQSTWFVNGPLSKFQRHKCFCVYLFQTIKSKIIQDGIGLLITINHSHSTTHGLIWMKISIKKFQNFWIPGLIHNPEWNIRETIVITVNRYSRNPVRRK